MDATSRTSEAMSRCFSLQAAATCCRLLRSLSDHPKRRHPSRPCAIPPATAQRYKELRTGLQWLLLAESRFSWPRRSLASLTWPRVSLSFEINQARSSFLGLLSYQRFEKSAAAMQLQPQSRMLAVNDYQVLSAFQPHYTSFCRYNHLLCSSSSFTRWLDAGAWTFLFRAAAF